MSQLVETKGLGEDVGDLLICQNIRKFDFTREDTLADKMVVHLNVLSPGVEAGILRKLDVAEVVAVDCRRIIDLRQPFLGTRPLCLTLLTISSFFLLHTIAALPRENVVTLLRACV